MLSLTKSTQAKTINCRSTEISGAISPTPEPQKKISPFYRAASAPLIKVDVIGTASDILCDRNPKKHKSNLTDSREFRDWLFSCQKLISDVLCDPD